MYTLSIRPPNEYISWPSSFVQYTMYNVHCTMYNVQCTMYIVQYTIKSNLKEFRFYRMRVRLTIKGEINAASLVTFTYQILLYSNTQILKYSIAQILKYSNTQILKYIYVSNTQIPSPLFVQFFKQRTIDETHGKWNRIRCVRVIFTYQILLYHLLSVISCRKKHIYAATQFGRSHKLRPCKRSGPYGNEY